MKNVNPKCSRRDMLSFFTRTAMGVTACSLLTGIPETFFQNPRKAFAALPQNDTITSPQFLIMSITNQGDPINCHVPGTYDDPNIYHGASANFASAQLNLGGSSVNAAKTWSQLDAGTLAKTSFFHGATYSGIHTDAAKILGLNGAISSSEMLVSSIGSAMQSPLMTIQSAPMLLTPQSVYAKGQPVSSIPPPSLQTIYNLSQLGPSTLASLRDASLNKINAWIKTKGTPAQSSYIDDFVKSQQESRQVPATLLNALTMLSDSTVQSQVSAAITLFQMRVTPAVVIYIPFGGDNHADAGLQNEAAAYHGISPVSTSGVLVAGKTGVAAIADMTAKIAEAGMTDQITFATLGVFGRTMGPTWRQGRTHNANHHVGVLIGPKVRGSVIGGVAKMTATGGGGNALAIDSSSGVGSTSGDIPFGETLSAYGKTIVRAVGLPEDTAETMIRGGKSVAAALA